MSLIYKNWKFIRKTILIIGLIFISFSFFINLVLYLNYKDNATPYLKNLPHKKVAIILGTNKYIAPNQENIFYNYRVRAGVQVYLSKKADKLLLSGWHDGGYDEAESMKKDLIKFGIPKSALILDKKSKRTYDSIKRAKEVYGLNDLIIISQPFHIKRALFLAKLEGIQAYGFLSQSPPFPNGINIYLREIFARLKIYFDIFKINI